MSGRSGSPHDHGEATETMASYKSPLGRPAAGGSPGLVLLYAERYEELAPAYVLGGHEVVIGRDPACGICVPGSAVSRQHARIQGRGGSLVLTDLGGRNGTIVNGALVNEVVLRQGDEIRVGDAIFKFVETDAEGYAQHRIDGAFVDPSSGAARPRLPAGRIIGGHQILRLAEAMKGVAKSSLSALILGESGTGKEVFAQQLHDWSGRRGSFQAVNCAAIPEQLIEGELFGHKRGAFSGADRDRTGLVRAAHGGTLFLDEIGDMPIEAQAKLLRMIQSKEVLPLGATTPEQVDVRIISATHRDLQKLMRKGGFRGDLFARLNEYSVTLPPLRERKEDIYSLCQALAARHGHPEARVTFPFMTALLHYHFPFNVRELEALIKRWTAVAPVAELDVQHLSSEIAERMQTYGLRRMTPTEPLSPPFPSSGPAPATPARPEPAAAVPRGTPPEMQLRELLAQHQGNVAAVARVYGKDRTQVHRWMKRYGIKIDDYR